MKPGPKKGTIKLTQAHRDKIANSKVLQCLINHATGDEIPGQEMTPSRVTAAVALLKKVLPDMTENALKGAGENGEHVITFKTIYEGK